jgi:RNA methyltransferase, TrmH family
MKLLTLARDLKRRKARERQSLFVAEGVRAVEELFASGLPIKGIITAPQLSDAARGKALKATIASGDIESVEVSELEFRSAAETDSPQGVLAIAPIPSHSFQSLSLGNHVRLVVLDAVQDPGNIGTILRTCAAFGVTATIALPGTVDLWNPKVVRAAMGAHFRHAAFHSTPEELFAFLDHNQIELVGTDASGGNIGTFSAPERAALVAGNEGAGLSDVVRSRVSRTVAIPIEPGVESLNVAVATGIVLYELRK